MSSVVISGDTSGAITLAAPAVAGTTTLTLPATTGSVIGSNSSGDIQFNSGYGSVATAYGCRAWVNFNGTGTVAIRASGNVSSITDNGVGLYTVNFTNALSDANYSCVSSATPLFGTASTVVTVYDNNSTYTANTTSVPILVRNQSTQNGQDVTGIAVAVFR
jgi:hypothetical protein